MKQYRLNVLISLASAVKQYDVEKLLNTVDTGDSVGPLKVEVALYKGEDDDATVADARSVLAGVKDGVLPKNDIRFILTGDAILADDFDISDTSGIDERLASDIGDVGVVAERGPCTLLYALNHDGLPLLYNGAIRSTFDRPSTGRTSATKVLNDFMLAVAWVVANQPPNAMKWLAVQDKASIMAAYNARQG